MAGSGQEPQPKAFSLNFKGPGKAAKPASKPGAPGRVAGFEDGAALAAGGPARKGQLIIPLPQSQDAARGPRAFRADRWEQGRGCVCKLQPSQSSTAQAVLTAAPRLPQTPVACRYLPQKEDEAAGLAGEHFVVAAPEVKPVGQYGLQPKKPGSGAPAPAVKAEASAAQPPREAPRSSADSDWMAARRGTTRQDDAKQVCVQLRSPAFIRPLSRSCLCCTLQLREDLMRLPDEASEAQYEAVPVELFGEAMLRGMGWSEGKALGRRATEVSLQSCQMQQQMLVAAGLCSRSATCACWVTLCPSTARAAQGLELTRWLLRRTSRRPSMCADHRAWAWELSLPGRQALIARSGGEPVCVCIPACTAYAREQGAISLTRPARACHCQASLAASRLLRQQVRLTCRLQDRCADAAQAADQAVQASSSEWLSRVLTTLYLLAGGQARHRGPSQTWFTSTQPQGCRRTSSLLGQRSQSA